MLIKEINIYRTSFRIAAIYALAGCLWILFSDRILASMVADPQSLTHMQTYKGWLYVVMTGALVFLLINKNLREIKISREALQERETRYRTLFEDSPISLWECDFRDLKRELDKLTAGDIGDLATFLEKHPREVSRLMGRASVGEVNAAAVVLFEARDKEELLTNFSRLYTTDSFVPMGLSLAALANGQRVVDCEQPWQTLAGRKIYTVTSLTVAPGCEQTWSRILVSLIDESYRKQAQLDREKLESQLKQAQRMESMGVLAGGIAHDFNNILTPLCGYASLALEELPSDSPARDDLQQVVLAAERARELVNQIVTFSRNDEQERQPVHMSRTVTEALKLLRSTLPSSIEIRQHIQDDAGTVQADPSQIHRVLMNLFTNAYQAMQDTGGVLEVTLKCVDIAPGKAAQRPGLEAGRYIELIVSDTGQGMDASLQERIFEPFFTTKGVGKGTGLGLSVVHGIVKGYGGDITVTSAINEGASFCIRLPQSAQAVPADSEKPVAIPRGTERIMVVDDEPQITAVVSRILTRLGYSVRTFTSSLEALDLLRSGVETCDVLITDCTMPHLSGKELALEAAAVAPNLPIILISGIHVDTSYERSRGVKIVDILMKPLDKRALAVAVRQAADAGSVKSPDGTFTH